MELEGTATRRPAWSVRAACLAIAIGFMLLAAWPYLAELPDLGSGNANDYFPTLDLLRDGDGWSLDLRRWALIRSNEHHVVVPALIYRANASLFDGDNRSLAVWCLGMMALSALALASMLPSSWRHRPAPFAASMALISGFAFTPVAAHNVALAFSGTMWLTANALVLGALASIQSSSRRPLRFALGLLLAVAASLTYSTGLMVWPLLILLALAQRQGWRRLAALALLATLSLGFSALSYRTPGHHPEPNTGQDLELLGDYAQTYLGSLYSNEVETAQAWGRVGLALALLTFGLLPLALGPQARRGLLAPWVVVALYGLINAVGTGVGRSGFGVEQATASRYATLAGFFWIALLAPALLLTFESSWSRMSRGRSAGACLIWLGALALWLGPTWDRGLDLVDRFVERASFHSAGHLALRYEIPDEQLLRHAFTPRPDQLWKVQPFFRQIGHIPFDRAVPPWPSGRLEPRGRFEGGRLGYLDTVTAAPEGWLRLRGWALHPEKPVAEVVLADRDGELLGPAVYGIHRPDVAKEIGPAARRTGFIGFVRARDSSRLPVAWVRLEGEEAFYPLEPVDGLAEFWSGERLSSLRLESPFPSRSR